MLEKLNNASKSELTQAGLWALAFIGVCVLVATGKLPADTVEKMLFALIGGMAMKRQGDQNASPSE